MMERLREGANSIWVKIILSLIILSFVFAGVGSYLASGNEQVAAKINGKEISQRQFEQVYQNERNRMQQRMGDYFSTLMSDPAYVKQFRQSVLDRMVNDELIQQRADKLGLSVSDAQVKQEILAMPAFAVDGVFNNEQYNMALRRAGFTPDQFAETIRKDMLRQQFLSALQGSDFVLSDEADELRKLESQQRVVRTLTLNLADFTKKVKVTEQEAQDFYDQNPNLFTRPAQIKVSYIELSGKGLTKDINISEQAAETYYKDNQTKFSSAEEREVSHILVTGDGAAAKAKAEALLAKLQNGANFAEVAKQSSDDTFSAKDGGKLEWFTKGTMDPAFEKEAFALAKPGDMSGLVKSSFGYHIILLDGIKPGKVKPFADVKAQIVAELQQQQSADEFYKLKSKLAEVAFESPDSLDAAAEAVKAKIVHTDYITPAEEKGVLANKQVQETLQSPEVHDDGMNSDVIELGPEHVIVVRVDDARAQAVLPFKDVAAKVNAMVASQKGEQQAQAKADEIIADLQKGKNDIVAKDGLSFSGEQTINRSGPNANISNVAFSLPKPTAGKATYGMARDNNGNVEIIALDKVVNMKLAGDKVNSQFEQQIEQMFAQEDLAATLKTLRESAKISYPMQDSSKD
ncbi:peptidylprolyl isomerase [Photobacterium sp. Alg240-V54]|uniref:peptidylprolyl isomerase n=1 Tax=Photobacterium sp. Alg240-V54 TaxID=2305995 RepID=UPI0013D5EFB2|nr:peptidylprolyl isomerase [Photobacterium sp. Alg240-V54]